LVKINKEKPILSPAGCANDCWQLSEILRAYLVPQAISSRSDVIGVHAAGVKVDDEAILIAGPSGSGKTALVLQLLRSPNTYYLGDDVVPITTGTRHALPLPTNCNVKDVSYLDDGLLHSVIDRWPAIGGRVLVPPASLPTARSGAQVNWIIAPRFDATAENTIEEMSKGSALMMLAEGCRNLGSEGLQSLGAICQQARGLRLTYGSSGGAQELLLSMRIMASAGTTPGGL
jgi:hypothetical protein